jgi:hypothetical protein
MASVFIIMPLRLDANVEAKRQTIIDVIGDNVILPQKCVDDPPPPFDISSAIETLKCVDLVIADLSFERPSCYFELGMAQAVGVPTFLIAESGTQLHQHAGSVRLYTGLLEFRQLIASAISESMGDASGGTQHNKRLQATRTSRAPEP